MRRRFGGSGSNRTCVEGVDSRGRCGSTGGRGAVDRTRHATSGCSAGRADVGAGRGSVPRLRFGRVSSSRRAKRCASATMGAEPAGAGGGLESWRSSGMRLTPGPDGRDKSAPATIGAVRSLSGRRWTEAGPPAEVGPQLTPGNGLHSPFGRDQGARGRPGHASPPLQARPARTNDPQGAAWSPAPRSCTHPSGICLDLTPCRAGAYASRPLTAGDFPAVPLTVGGGSLSFPLPTRRLALRRAPHRAPRDTERPRCSASTERSASNPGAVVPSFGAGVRASPSRGSTADL